MSPDTPAWQSMDPMDEGLPAQLDSLGDSVKGCVVLLVAEGIDRRWGAEAGLRVARGWAATGRKVLLADAALDDPILHAVAGTEHAEGISDVVLYGASVQRVASPVDGAVLVVSAGTPVGDAEEVLAHARWGAIIDGFREAGATLLVHLPVETPGAAALMERADRVVVVAPSNQDVGAMVGDASDRVLAVLGPEEAAAEVDGPEVALDDTTLMETPEPTVEEPISDPELAAPTSEPELGTEPDAEERQGDAAFSTASLPDATSDGVGDVASSDSFSMDAIGGSQYGDAEPEGELQPMVLDLGESVTGEAADSPEDEGLDLGGADLEMEAPDVEASERVAPPDVDEPAAVSEEESVVPDVSAGDAEELAEELAEEPGLPAMEVDRSEIEMDKEEMATTAGEARLSMDGFETGAGFEMDFPESGPADSAEEDGAPAADVEAGTAAETVEPDHEGAGFDFGDAPLEVEAAPFADEVPLAEAEGVDPSDVPDVEDLDPFGGVDLGVPAPAAVAADEAEDAEGDEAPFVDVAEETSEEAAAGVEEGVTEVSQRPAEDAAVPAAPARKLSGLDELDRRRKRGVRMRQLVVGAATMLIVGGGGLTAAYFGIVNIPGITPPENVRFSVPAPVDLPGPRPETPVMSHALFIDAWRDLETSVSTVAALRDRLPEFLFFVAVVEVDEARQYGVFAGPAYNAVEANTLKEPLAPVLDRLDPDSWIVQEARYAFFFGEYESGADADARAAQLGDMGIPTYVLQVAYADESVGLRVYGGAYIDEFQAVQMGRYLTEHDITGVPFTERRGRLPE